MNDDFEPYLCGGILFSFLIELKNDTNKTLHKTWGAKENVLNQYEMMKKLILVIKPNYVYESGTLKKDTSLYHSCQKVGDTIIPFENEFTIEEFDKSVRNQYDEVLKRMTKFTAECFPTCTSTVMRHLVEKTLVLIRDDNSIKNNAQFFINENGSSIYKEALLRQKNFCFQSFLVGIWHYILTKPTINTNGRPTFEKIFAKDNNKKSKLDTRCFNNINVTGKEIFKESTSKVNYECQNIIDAPKAVKEEKTEIKVYYTGGLLDDKEENAILSYSPEIIDLDENPNISIKDYPYGPIYKITTEFQIKSEFRSNMEEIIRIYFKIGSFNISGTTSEERWISKSKLNNMLFNQKNTCTVWFRLEKYSENEYSAEFLLIGRIIQ